MALSSPWLAATMAYRSCVQRLGLSLRELLLVLGLYALLLQMDHLGMVQALLFKEVVTICDQLLIPMATPSSAGQGSSVEWVGPTRLDLCTRQPIHLPDSCRHSR